MSTYKKIQKVLVALIVGMLCAAPVWGFAQAEKGVTRAGESTKASPVKPYVNEFGKLVCWPRVNSNGKLLTYGPIVDTEGADEITSTTAKLHGNILHDGWCSPITEQGFEVSTTADFSSIVTTVTTTPVPTFTPCVNYPTCSCTDNQYAETVDGLTPSTKYYYRAYAKNSCGTGYGDTLDFTTENSFTLALNSDHTPNEVTFCVTGTETEDFIYTAVTDPVTIPSPTYKWYYDGTVVSGATSSTYTHTYAKADEGTHTIKCEVTSASVTKDATITTTVKVTNPTVTYTGITGTLTVCNGGSTTLTANATAASGTTLSYRWLKGTSDIPGATTATLNTGALTATEDFTCIITPKIGTCDGYPIEQHVTVTVVTIEPTRDTLKICDCQFPFTWTHSSGTWTETWTAADITTNPTRSHTFTTAAGCDSLVYITLKTWSAMEERPTSCHVASLGTNEIGSGTTLTKVKDYDNNEYTVVEIGGYCWMKQNLRSTHFADGGALVPATDVDADGMKTNIYYTTSGTIYTKGVCGGNLTFEEYTNRYGLMYNWYTAMRNNNPGWNMHNVQGICPNGWHLPDTTEWQRLERATGFNGEHSETVHTFVGTSAIQLVTGCEWKQSSVAGSPGDYNALGRNASDFSVRPAGCFLDVAHNIDGTNYPKNTFAYSGIWAFFWSSTRFQFTTDGHTPAPGYSDARAAYNYDITFDKTGIARDVNGRDYLIGRSVRCIRNY